MTLNLIKAIISQAQINKSSPSPSPFVGLSMSNWRRVHWNESILDLRLRQIRALQRNKFLYKTMNCAILTWMIQQNSNIHFIHFWDFF
jgi:hypothetical protein